MAKKPALRKKSAAKGKPAARAKPVAKARPVVRPTKAAGKARLTARPAPKPASRPASKAASRPIVAARPAARPAPQRATGDRPVVPRQQPETLRLQGLSCGLTVDDLARSMRFWVDGLGFYVKERYERNGVLSGVGLVAGACEVNLNQDDWAKGRGRLKGVGVRLYAETNEDLAVLAERVRRRGVPAAGPVIAPWGARVLHFNDPDGFQLTIYEEMGG
jgi:catechol 2,3-dioxygenase-like lactoylglutathione lyase family enzyme